jgi:predicted Rossmann-fold nucleotide-binding protein
MPTIELPGDLPYDPFRTGLYTREELMAGWPGETLDGRIERHVHDHGFRAPPAAEALAQRLHDHSIDVALSELLCADPRQRVVGIMGGATTRRDDPWYRRAAELARLLTRSGFVVATGGGPGTMEAANLGAFLASHDDGALDEALRILARVPAYEDDVRPYMACAAEVRERFPTGETSLAIPTWFYPGEPVGQFASHIAKYFANALREDGLLARCTAGVVFLPGAAGTVQEIFDAATPNYYGSRGEPAPMVLVDREHWTTTLPAWPLLRALAGRRPMADRIALVDSVDEAPAALAALTERTAGA